MSEVSSRRIEANRRNAQKSTGPRTEEGKARSRFNAVKHGMRAKSTVLPGEDAAAFEARLSRWSEDIGPRDDVERFLVRRAVQLSWQLDRIDRVQASRRPTGDRVTGLADEVTAIGARLFRDRRGPTSLYPQWIDEFGGREVISWNARTADDPEDPARLLNRLESSAMGCAWLLDQWAELRESLESGGNWQPPDRFRAIRLLGRQPFQALEDGRVRTIYLACAAMETGDVDPFADLSVEMNPRAMKRFSARLHERLEGQDLPVGPEAGRSALLTLIDQETRRLEEILTIFLDADQADALAAEIEEDERADRLRRHQAACDRTLLRVLETIRRRHRESDAPAPRASRTPPPSPVPTPAPEPIVTPPIVPESEAEPEPHVESTATNEPNVPRPAHSARLAAILALLLAFMVPGRADGLLGRESSRATATSLPKTHIFRPFDIPGTLDRARRAGLSPMGPVTRRSLANHDFPCTPPVL